MLGVNVGAVALLSDRERADRMASEEQHGRLISVSKDEIKVNVDAQLPPSRPKQLAAFKCGRSHFSTFLKNERAQGRHDLPSEYDSIRCRDIMFEKGRALFERYFAYCAEQHGKYKPGTLKNYISQLHVDLVYRTQDVAQLCPCLHGDWSKRVDTVVKAITVARHHGGLSVASHAAAFTEEDWILMSTALADDDTPRSQTLLAALNFAVLLMGRTSDVGGAKQTKTSVRMARGLMQFGLMRVKGRQAQYIGIAEAMDNPMRSVEEPFLFRGAGSDPKALFKEVISRAVAVLAANGRWHLLSPGITAHSLRNCAFNIALEHPDVPPAAVSMHGGWADATWSRSNAGTGPEVVYHVFKHTQNDMVARAIRRCADLRFGGLHPTLPPFDPAWSDDQPLRMAYAFAEVWFVENADYIDPSLVRAASASVLMWFSYWEERLGSDCLRCRQVLDTASLAGFGRETVIRIGNQIRETWMASQVGAVETTLADPDRPVPIHQYNQAVAERDSAEQEYARVEHEVQDEITGLFTELYSRHGVSPLSAISSLSTMTDVPIHQSNQAVVGRYTAPLASGVVNDQSRPGESDISHGHPGTSRVAGAIKGGFNPAVSNGLVIVRQFSGWSCRKFSEVVWLLRSITLNCMIWWPTRPGSAAKIQVTTSLQVSVVSDSAYVRKRARVLSSPVHTISGPAFRRLASAPPVDPSAGASFLQLHQMPEQCKIGYL
ncbi:unnamed protein product (mitochondrion) [Plasmodiophora brassicae]|uniref:Uncharacterized protein n=1 Tax=Plasmodiophora brassicae TaxID=37360 RepID=A0A3P3Y8E7_PLABS|nr:unnamed protein product [Plasmodiophora brassicae]